MVVLSQPWPLVYVVLYTLFLPVSGPSLLCATHPLRSASSLLHKSFVIVFCVSAVQFRPEQSRMNCLPPSPSHGHRVRCESCGLVADAVQSDLCGRLLCLYWGLDYRGGCALHPRVVEYVLEGWAVGRPERQTPLNQLLALWRRRKRRGN